MNIGWRDWIVFLSCPLLLLNTIDLFDFYIHTILSLPLHIFEHAKALVGTPDLPLSLCLSLLFLKWHGQSAFSFNWLVILSTNTNNSLLVITKIVVLRAVMEVDRWLIIVLRRVIVIARACTVWYNWSPTVVRLDYTTTVDRRMTNLSNWLLLSMNRIQKSARPEVIDAVHRHPHTL